MDTKQKLNLEDYLPTSYNLLMNVGIFLTIIAGLVLLTLNYWPHWICLFSSAAAIGFTGFMIGSITRRWPSYWRRNVRGYDLVLSLKDDQLVTNFYERGRPSWMPGPHYITTTIILPLGGWFRPQFGKIFGQEDIKIKLFTLLAAPRLDDSICITLPNGNEAVLTLEELFFCFDNPEYFNRIFQRGTNLLKFYIDEVVRTTRLKQLIDNSNQALLDSKAECRSKKIGLIRQALQEQADQIAARHYDAFFYRNLWSKNPFSEAKA